MIKKAIERISNLEYQKFKEKPQKLISPLHEIRESDVEIDKEYIIEKLITTFIIVIEDFYLEDDYFNKFICETSI